MKKKAVYLHVVMGSVLFISEGVFSFFYTLFTTLTVMIPFWFIIIDNESSEGI